MLPGRTYTPIEYALMAWRRRWVIVASLVAVVYSALLVSSQLRDVYTSEMLIQVVPQRVPDDYVRSTVTLRTEDRLSALTQQVLSRTALESLMTEMDLYLEERARLPMQDVVELMRERVEVEVMTSRNAADAFFVRFTYSDPEVATRVTERVGALFIDLNAKDRGDLAEATDAFLQSQLGETRRKLEEQEQKLEVFRQHNAGRLPSQLTFNMQTIQNIQLAIQAHVESLARDRDRRLLLERLYGDAEAEMTSAPVAAPIPTSQQPLDPAVAAGANTQQQMATAREALSRLELRLKPEHPDVVRAKRQIQELESRAAEEASSAMTAPDAPEQAGSAAPAPRSPDELQRRSRLTQLRAEMESLDRQITFKEAEEERLRASLATYQGRIEEIPGLESEFTALTRDYDTQQAAYKELLSKSEQSQVAVELERRQIGEQFRVLDPARVPVRPAGIRRVQVNTVGVLLGLVLGLGLAALLEVRDTTFHSSGDVSDVLKLPVVALVPYVVVDVDRKRDRRRRLLASACVAALAVAGLYGAWALQLWQHVV